MDANSSRPCHGQYQKRQLYAQNFIKFQQVTMIHVRKLNGDFSSTLNFTGLYIIRRTRKLLKASTV